jgi:Spy/CpxP family protein refolding chaperone
MNMKKTLLIVGLAVLAVGVVGVGVAFAQGPRPPLGGSGYGWKHDYVEQALAEKLGLTEAQVEEAFAAGKPMYQIALDNGIKQEDLTDFMNAVHADAFAQAVKDGVITQEQADWMLQRMQNRYQNGYGPGKCPMYNGLGAPLGRGRGVGPGMMQNRGNGYGPGMMWNWGTQNP